MFVMDNDLKSRSKQFQESHKIMGVAVQGKTCISLSLLKDRCPAATSARINNFCLSMDNENNNCDRVNNSTPKATSAARKSVSISDVLSRLEKMEEEMEEMILEIEKNTKELKDRGASAHICVGAFFISNILNFMI